MKDKQYLLLVILNDPGKLPELLQAWKEIGVPGVTVLEGAGGYHTATWLSAVGLGALDRLLEADELRRRALLSAIDDPHLLDQAVAEAERVVGGFERPESGLLLVLPVMQARGIMKRLVEQEGAEEEVPPPALQPEWRVQRDTPVEEVDAILKLKPIVVQAETPLDQVALAMLKSPNVHVACVVDEAGRLVGLLRLRALADDLFFHIMPEEFLSEISDLEEVGAYADKSRMRTAADAMQEPVWVKVGETVKDAFKRMHEHQLTGLPVVDDQYRVVGYINLLELLAACVGRSAPAGQGGEAR